MKLDFRKNMKRNVSASAVNGGMRVAFPFLNRTLFLWLLGPEYLGLNGLFASVLGVLMLSELGFGKALVCSMYKPVADDDSDLLCAYLNFYRTAYRWIGAAVFTVGIALLPFLRRLVHGDVPPDINLHILYLIHLVNTSVSYFLFAYRGSVLDAYHRSDVVTNIRSAVSAAQYVAVFLILLVTRNYYHYVFATVFFTVLQNILIVIAARRLFPGVTPRGDLPESLRRHIVSDVKSIFLHKVGGVISYMTDNIVISAFLGLVAVAAYGNYFYVATTVACLVGSIYSSVSGGFGNKIYTESREENFELFMKMVKITQLVVLWCTAMMAALYQPFIEIWTKGDPVLLRHALTPLLVVVYFYLNQSRQMLLSFKDAAALWRSDRWKPIVAGALNLAFSIAFLVFLPAPYKLDGVIFATILGYAAVQVPWESHVVFSEFFGDAEARRYWRMQALFAVAAAVLTCVTWAAASAVPLGGLAGIALKALVAAAVSAVAMLAVFRSDMTAVGSALLRR